MMDERVAAMRAETSTPAQRPETYVRGGAEQRGALRSPVRTLVALLVQQPALIEQLEPPYLFAVLRQPGIPLLMELIALCRARPGVSTGALLEQFEGREEQVHLGKLALMPFPAAPEHWPAEFREHVEQLNRQTLQQRVDDLFALQAERALSESEKAELREGLAAKSRR